MSCWDGMGRNPSSSSASVVWFGPCSNIQNWSLYKQITVYFTAVIQRLIDVCEVLITLWEIGLQSSN